MLKHLQVLRNACGPRDSVMASAVLRTLFQFPFLLKIVSRCSPGCAEILLCKRKSPFSSADVLIEK